MAIMIFFLLLSLGFENALKCHSDSVGYLAAHVAAGRIKNLSPFKAHQSISSHQQLCIVMMA
jgi:hypothetical protein